jgi:hypothetical protein
MGFRQGGPAGFGLLRVLTNEKYIGNNVYNRHSFKLKKKHVDNPPEMWIRKEGAFDSIVPVATFMATKEILAERSKKLTDAELLDHLKALYAVCGRLSGFIIDQAPALPSAATYIQRFGSLTRAYDWWDTTARAAASFWKSTTCVSSTRKSSAAPSTPSLSWAATSPATPRPIC